MDGRLASRDCFFAVKKNVDEIKREEFKEPKKNDEYSTSVLGIQFTKGNSCIVEIISRYNHTVGNPNCTLGNDLNRLAPGLEQSFANLLSKRGLTLNSSNKEEFYIPGYTIANDGRYYKYNLEINREYYCPGNIIISDGEVEIVSNPEEGLLIDYFFLDKKNKRIKVIGEDIVDSFVDDLQDIENIEVVKSKEENIERIIKIYKMGTDIPIIIGIDRDNQIVKYENKNVTKIGDCFLFYNEKLTHLELPSLKQVQDEFLYCNDVLTRLELPNLKLAGTYFLSNSKLTQLSLPNLIKVKSGFLECNAVLIHLKLLSLIQVGSEFLYYNEVLSHLELPSLKEVGDNFLWRNQCLTNLKLPSLTKVGDNFLCNNEDLTHLELPNLTQAGKCFLHHNQGLTQLELPNLTKVGGDFLYCNKLRKKFSYRIAESKKVITPKGIAQLDKDSELTMSETGNAQRIIQGLSKEIDENQQEMK